jgi:2-polyprenyl-3-methyl-5-hydroxy-6-metoxy-1,4-benzoquinol methylase
MHNRRLSVTDFAVPASRPLAFYENILAQVAQECKERPVDLIGELSYGMYMLPAYAAILLDVDQALGGGGKRILDIGAFSGWLSFALAKLGYSIVAHDIPEFLSGTSLQRRFAELGVGTVAVNLRDDRIPLDDGSFDCVLMCEVLEHLNFNPLPVLAELNRLMRPDGLLYVTTPNAGGLIPRVKLAMGRSIRFEIGDFLRQFDVRDNMTVGLHWREYTGAELRELLSISGLGFAVERLNYRLFLTPAFNRRLIYRFLCWCVPSFRPTLSLFARKRAGCTLHFPKTEALT